MKSTASNVPTQPLHLRAIKVLTDLVQGMARFAIDMQVLKDLKKRGSEARLVMTTRSKNAEKP